MDLKQHILHLAHEQAKITTSQILDSLGQEYSRQYINRVINQLIDEGRLIKGGSTKGAFYVVPQNAYLAEAATSFKKTLKNHQLKEHEILDELQTNPGIYSRLQPNIQDVVNYAFSEMLNNAIEHSSSETIKVEVYINENQLTFTVRDFGIGVFRSIKRKKQLGNELEAIQDLLKGKTTTMPQAHSGEGIFFTSKMARKFSLESYDYKLLIDNEIDDVFVEELSRPKTGTKVTFQIPVDTDTHTTEVFKQYQTRPETLAFDKTKVQIKLYTMGTVHVSRSQARRVLENLDKFQKIVLDFENVPTIGQGFADEIFRVFKLSHPQIEVEYINANQAVKFMIERVEDPQLQLKGLSEEE